MEVEIPPPPVLFLENGHRVAEATTPPYDGEQKALGRTLATQASPEPPSPPYHGEDEKVVNGSVVAIPYLEPEPPTLPSMPGQENYPVRAPPQWRSIPDEVPNFGDILSPLD